MRTKTITMLALLTFVLGAASVSAQSYGFGSGDGVCNFIDEDGDGFNDLAPDADGDGIPNGMDPDYIPAGDGTGNQYKWGRNGTADGIAKTFGFTGEKIGEGKGNGNGNHYGPGDGTGSGVGPADGTGFGPGTGDCDGTGSTSKGVGHRGGRR